MDNRKYFDKLLSKIKHKKICKYIKYDISKPYKYLYDMTLQPNYILHAVEPRYNEHYTLDMPDYIKDIIYVKIGHGGPDDIWDEKVVDKLMDSVISFNKCLEKNMEPSKNLKCKILNDVKIKFTTELEDDDHYQKPIILNASKTQDFYIMLMTGKNMENFVKHLWRTDKIKIKEFNELYFNKFMESINMFNLDD
jgi:hypothetical protein